MTAPLHGAQAIGSEPLACPLLARPARAAGLEDLDRVNEVVTASVGSWYPAPRVRRLAHTSVLYAEPDLAHMSVLLVDDPSDCGVAVATWEQAAEWHVPPAARGAILHGLHVVPRWQRMGFRTGLPALAEQRAAARGLDGIAVRAVRVAERFFRSCGFHDLEVDSARAPHPRRIGKSLARA